MYPSHSRRKEGGAVKRLKIDCHQRKNYAHGLGVLGHQQNGSTNLV
jgi:hypothetical protein